MKGRTNRFNSDFLVKSSGNVMKTSCPDNYFYSNSLVVEASESRSTSSYRAENADNFVFNSDVAPPRKRTMRSIISAKYTMIQLT